MRNPWKLLGIFLIVVFFGAIAIKITSVVGFFEHGENVSSPKKNSILVLDLEGVIIDGKKFLARLKKYAKQDEIKGILIRINSPGGVVGPSQEIYAELKRVREELKKPIVVSANAVMASGAYYAAVACDKIVANPGTLVGSIGVIMEFANLEKLYDWAKIKKFSLTTGPYKDTGSESRAMRDDEKQLIKQMLSEVHMQFKLAVAEGRHLPLEKVIPYADGRIFTGEGAKKIGLIDQLGTFEDARRLVGTMAGLGTDPKTFEPPNNKPNWLLETLMGSNSDEDEEGHTKLTELVKSTLNSSVALYGKPLFLMPGAWVF